MILKTLSSCKQSLKGKRVLLRVDFNVPLTRSGRPANLERLQASLPTIKYLVAKGAKIVILSHLGRPNGRIEAGLSNKPVAMALSRLLKRPVTFIAGKIPTVTDPRMKLKNGQIVFLENLRFFKGEEKNDRAFAAQLAALGDIYINDAFAVSHRANASLCAVTQFLPSFAGLLLAKEVSNLTKVFSFAKKPKIAIIGGAKTETKVKLVSSLLPIVDKILLGGAVANDFLRAKGFSIGASLASVKSPNGLKSFLGSNKLVLPSDVVVANSLSKPKIFKTKKNNEVLKTEAIVDLGPETIKKYLAEIMKAKLVLWNGPLGYFEFKQARLGTISIAKLLASPKFKGYGVIGGGETLEAGKWTNRKNIFVSTGGGAMLEFLSGNRLSALLPLILKK